MLNNIEQHIGINEREDLFSKFCIGSIYLVLCKKNSSLRKSFKHLRNWKITFK